jgi:hypothetical protein
LESGEAYHQLYPDTFEIPPRRDRENLRRGQLAKLVFKFLVERNGVVETDFERMWVFVTERIRSYFIGRLDNQPIGFPPSDDVYLVVGAEIPFQAEHVVQIMNPPPHVDVDDYLSSEPTREWPR